MAAVLDLDAGDAIEHLVIADIDVVAHADINRGILDAREDVVFNQPVFTELRKNAIHARVDDPVIADGKIIPRLTHYGVAFVVGDLEPFHREAVSRIQNGVVKLLVAIEVGPVAAFNDPAQGDVVFVDVDCLAVEPGIDENLVAWRGLINRILNALAFTHLNDGRLRSTSR